MKQGHFKIEKTPKSLSFGIFVLHLSFLLQFLFFCSMMLRVVVMMKMEFSVVSFPHEQGNTNQNNQNSQNCNNDSNHNWICLNNFLARSKLIVGFINCWSWSGNCRWIKNCKSIGTQGICTIKISTIWFLKILVFWFVFKIWIDFLPKPVISSVSCHCFDISSHSISDGKILLCRREEKYWIIIWMKVFGLGLRLGSKHTWWHLLMQSKQLNWIFLFIPKKKIHGHYFFHFYFSISLRTSIINNVCFRLNQTTVDWSIDSRGDSSEIISTTCWSHDIVVQSGTIGICWKFSSDPNPVYFCFRKFNYFEVQIFSLFLSFSLPFFLLFFLFSSYQLDVQIVLTGPFNPVAKVL